MGYYTLYNKCRIYVNYFDHCHINRRVWKTLVMVCYGMVLIHKYIWSMTWDEPSHISFNQIFSSLGAIFSVLQYCYVTPPRLNFPFIGQSLIDIVVPLRLCFHFHRIPAAYLIYPSIVICYVIPFGWSLAPRNIYRSNLFTVQHSSRKVSPQQVIQRDSILNKKF